MGQNNIGMMSFMINTLFLLITGVYWNPAMFNFGCDCVNAILTIYMISEADSTMYTINVGNYRV